MDLSWVQGELGGPGQLLPPPSAAPSTGGAAAKGHPVSVLSTLKHREAHSSPGQCAVLLECGISHTGAPACMLRMWVEANTHTGTNISSFRNVRALGSSYLCPCARVQRNYTRGEANTKGMKPQRWVRVPCAPHTHVCQCAHIMHPKCKYISGVYTRTAVSYTSMQLRAPRDAHPTCL